MFVPVLLLAAALAQCSVSDTATIRIEVNPPDATVLVDGTPIAVTNGVAVLEVAWLPCGRRYQYEITAKWGSVEQKRKVVFARGDQVTVKFSKAEAEAALLPTVPVAGIREEDGVYNYGIDRGQFRNDTERFTIDGKEISREEAIRLLQQNSLQDDSAKLRLTVIGSDEDRRAVMNDLRGPLADIAKECLVQEYRPDNWAVAKAGFYTSGKPTIYIQSPDGTVLHRQDDYSDGAQGLRAAFEQLRRPDPFYRPDKDPDLRKPQDGFLSRLLNFLAFPFRSLLSWLATIAVVFLLFVAITKGWLFYLLGLIINLVPTAPSPPARRKSQSNSRSRPRRRK